MPQFASLNDDQLALLGCAVALFLCGGGMVLSYTLRRWITGAGKASAEYARPEASAAQPHVAGADSDQRRAA
jgi:hypothetical protein